MRRRSHNSPRKMKEQAYLWGSDTKVPKKVPRSTKKNSWEMLLHALGRPFWGLLCRNPIGTPAPSSVALRAPVLSNMRRRSHNSPRKMKEQAYLWGSDTKVPKKVPRSTKKNIWEMLLHALGRPFWGLLRRNPIG